MKKVDMKTYQTPAYAVAERNTVKKIDKVLVRKILDRRKLRHKTSIFCLLCNRTKYPDREER